MIKNYLQFINEDFKSDKLDSIEGEYSTLKKEILEKIIDTLDSEDEKELDEFLSDYIKNSEKRIEGLINDADIYEFYLSNRGEIDELLSKINFYEEAPSDQNSFSLYDYIVTGTKKAISEVVSMLKEKGE